MVITEPTHTSTQLLIGSIPTIQSINYMMTILSRFIPERTDLIIIDIDTETPKEISFIDTTPHVIKTMVLGACNTHDLPLRAILEPCLVLL